MNARFAFAMARREARSSWRRLVLYGACMSVGIAALVGLQGLRSTVQDAVDGQSRELLGADLLLTSRVPFGGDSAARIADLVRRGGTPGSRITRFGSMVRAERSGATRLVDVQGVEGGFPFYGEIRTEPAGVWQTLVAARELTDSTAGIRAEERVALVDPGLLVQLDAQPGETLVVGHARFRIAGTVTRSPGTFGIRTQLAPRVFIARRFVDDTELVQRGSLVEHRLYLRADAGVLEPWLEANRSALESERVRIQTVEGYQRDLGRSFGALTQYLGMVGLAALALGGIGVAAGVRVFVRDKLDSVAVLRSLGAQSVDLVVAYGSLALALGALSGSVGAALGVAFQAALPLVLEDFLPVEVTVRVEPVAVATGIAIGLWVTALFAAAPLFDLSRVPPLRALRRDFGTQPEARAGRFAMVAALAATVLGASLLQAPSWRSGLGFALGIGAVLAVLALAAAGAAAALRAHVPRGAPFWLRQGISNLFRPRNHTLATTLAIGFGLFLVATLHIVQFNVLRELARDSRPDRPNLVLFDVQRHQVAELERFLEERGAPILERAPIVSARIESAGGRGTKHALAQPDRQRGLRWALGREYRVTYTDSLRDSETVIAGRWWKGDGPLRDGQPVPVSLEREIAASLRVGVGDEIRWSVQGVPIDSVVQSVREVDWGRMGTNFFALFPPGVLEEAPQSSVVLARLDGDQARAELQRDLVTRFPNVSVLDATMILRSLDALMSKTSLAVRVVALFVVATGFGILIAAAAAARHERTREALLLRTLGASAQTVRRVIVSEAVALGALAALVGAGLAVLAGWGLVHYMFELSFSPPWFDLAALSLATVAVTALVGAGSGGSVARKPPLAGLRAAELGT